MIDTFTKATPVSCWKARGQSVVIHRLSASEAAEFKVLAGVGDAEVKFVFTRKDERWALNVARVVGLSRVASRALAATY